MFRQTGKLRFCFIILAAVFIIIALFMLTMVFVFDQLFLKLLYKKLAMSPDSLLFENWLEPSLPIYFSIHLFNLTNKDEFLNGGKAKLNEVGPFVYRETRQRFDVEFSSETPPEKVRYKHRIWYHFQPHLSVGSPEIGHITTPSMVRAGAYAKLGAASSWLYPDPFITLSPQEAMWDIPGVFGNTAIFGQINGTEIDEFVMDTGSRDIHNIGKIYEANGLTQLDLWDSNVANMINGSDGSLAPPGMHIGSEFKVFVPNICRSVVSYGVGETTTKHRDDIEVIVFSANAPEELKALEKHRTEMFHKKDFPIPVKGLLSMEPCLHYKSKRAPVYISQPRFMGSDPSVIAPFEDLAPPDPREHSTRIHIESHTGLILEAYKRVQLNLYMDTQDSVFEKLNQSTYFPIAWIAETAIVEKHALDELANKLFRPRRIIPIIMSIVGAVATILAVGLIMMLAFCTRTGRSRSHRSKVSDKHSSSSPVLSSVGGSGDGTQPKSTEPSIVFSTELSAKSKYQVPKARRIIDAHPVIIW